MTFAFFASSSIFSLHFMSAHSGYTLEVSAIVRPSGDQTKFDTPVGMSVIFFASPPSTGMTQIWDVPSRSERNARRLPSGDQAGEESSASLRTKAHGVPPGDGNEIDIGVRRVLVLVEAGDLEGDELPVGRNGEARRFSPMEMRSSKVIPRGLGRGRRARERRQDERKENEDSERWISWYPLFRARIVDFRRTLCATRRRSGIVGKDGPMRQWNKSSRRNDSLH